MLYLGTCPNQDVVKDLLDRKRIGLMCQPASNKPRAGWLWAADNGCFSEKWNAQKWAEWISRGLPKAGCLFAVVPDVVGDAEETLRRFDRHVGTIRHYRYPVAFVAQDGQEEPAVPWSEIDCLFIGGSTEWKMSDHAFTLARRARELGKWVHIGRVNSESRFKAWAAHADSCDGTFLAFGPKVNTPRLMRWLDNHDESPQLEFSERA